LQFLLFLGHGKSLYRLQNKGRTKPESGHKARSERIGRLRPGCTSPGFKSAIGSRTKRLLGILGCGTSSFEVFMIRAAYKRISRSSSLGAFLEAFFSSGNTLGTFQRVEQGFGGRTKSLLEALGLRTPRQSSPPPRGCLCRPVKKPAPGWPLPSRARQAQPRPTGTAAGCWSPRRGRLPPPGSLKKLARCARPLLKSFRPGPSG